MTTLDVRVRQGFVGAPVPADLVDELLEAFAEAKRRFYRDDLRPSEIEGARFSEAAFRILQWGAGQNVTAFGKTLPSVDDMMKTLVKVQGSTTASASTSREHCG